MTVSDSNPTNLDEAVRMFKGYVLGENGFDELDFKEWLIEWREQEIAEAKAQVAQAVEDTTAMAQDGTIWIDYIELHESVTLESLRTKSPKGETNGKTN